MSTTTNLSESYVLMTGTIHFGIRGEYGEMLDWVVGRSAVPEVAAVGRLLALYATVFEGETYLARGHIARFCNLMVRVSSNADDEGHSDHALLARLRDLSGRPTLNGEEIRAIRIRQGRGE